MKETRKCSVSDVSMDGGDLIFTVHYTGGLKDQETKTNWSVDNINLRVRYRVPAEKALASCGSSEWIALQTKLRKTGKKFCDDLKGKTYSQVKLESMINAVVPKANREALKILNARLWNMLREAGYSDEEIEAQLSNME